MMDGTHLTGLEGANPLGFLAALGVQVLFLDEPEQPRLWWTDDVMPRAVVDIEFTEDRIVEQALRTFPKWANSPALSPGFGDKAAGDAKFKPEDIRRYLDYSLSGGPGCSLPAALVAEGSLDSSKGAVAKPSDLYFTAGQQRFLSIARDILEGVARDDVVNGLVGPWQYSSQLSSLMWDVADDRTYALTAADPTNNTLNPKLTNPGAEALAILGLSRYPVFAGRDRTLTRGCAGEWRRGGSFTWPLWSRPAGCGATDSLLAHATADAGTRRFETQRKWYGSWGITQIMTATIRRSDQGGYGTFGPPRIIWSAADPG
ncbi:MAG: hypothetical protein OXG55_13150 [bacterium]|nr:hypothetical protein [bacterium]MCY4104184.1 hypothetical protein [bacterium]